MYGIFDRDTREEIISADGLEGFFVEAGSPERGEIGLVNARPGVRSPLGSNDSEIQIFNWSGEVIGSYHLGAVKILTSGSCEGAMDETGSHSFIGYTSEYFEAGEIWSRWASGIPLALGEWALRPAGHHESWLHVSQTSWFAVRRGNARIGKDESISIDGLMMPVKASFYCAIGEAANGPGGYLGSNLDALSKCLLRAGDEAPVRRVEWKNFSVAEEVLGREFTADVASVFEDSGVLLIRN
ncbi:barstar family protein [Kitasatospora sp. NBC_00085]